MSDRKKNDRPTKAADIVHKETGVVRFRLDELAAVVGLASNALRNGTGRG